MVLLGSNIVLIQGLGARAAKDGTRDCQAREPACQYALSSTDGSAVGSMSAVRKRHGGTVLREGYLTAVLLLGIQSFLHVNPV